MVSQEVPMETAIGVFDSRDRAEEALKGLIEHHVPQDSIVFMTRSENEAKTVGKELGTYVGALAGGAAGMSAGVAVATLLVPGLGAVFALGFGAAALLGLAGGGAGAALGKAISDDPGVPQPTPDEKCSEDVVFFREVLEKGRSLIVVRTDSHEIAIVACGFLDRLGLGMERPSPVKMQVVTRQLDGVTVLDVRGRITVGEGNVVLREMIRDLVEKGRKRILLNFYEVDYVDSSGLGELVRIHVTLRKAGGQMKLLNLSKRVEELLQMTSLNTVFDVQKNEASAIRSFDQAAGATA
jgi:anti-sigma B factor antagonist